MGNSTADDKAAPTAAARFVTSGSCFGFYLRDFEVSGFKSGDLPAVLARLRAVGFEPAAPPAAPELPAVLTPNGNPICPKHGAEMHEQGANGDLWKAHRVPNPRDPSGKNDAWCHGAPGTRSPGWYLEWDATTQPTPDPSTWPDQAAEADPGPPPRRPAPANGGPKRGGWNR